MNDCFSRLFPAAVLLCCTWSCGTAYLPRNGDIIFHTSRSAQSEAIQKVTNSPFSHMGIVYVQQGRAFVFEAVEPVKSTPLDEWIARGVQGKYVVKRLREADRLLTADALARMKEVGELFRGRHYDLYFEWSDEQVYCSELVWKIYKRALGLEIGELQQMSAFDLTDPLVRAKVEERWGGDPPGDEIVISPESIFRSDLLMTVAEAK
jgi:hypothetical protein